MKRFTLAILFWLTLGGVAVASEPAIRSSRVEFAPVTFSLGCVETTKASNRRIISRSDQGVGVIEPKECVDAATRVGDAKLISVAIGKNEKLQLFEVILKLDTKDAQKLAEITSSGNPRRIVLSVKGKAVVVGYNNAPFHGDRYWISADSLEAARHIADLFNK